jgi:hypothetical protein
VLPGEYCGVMTVVSTIAGVLLIVVALNDVFHTLLRPASTGRLTTYMFRAAWSVSHRRPALLTVGGPLTILVTIGVWIVLVTVGWALIYLPHFPDGFLYSDLDPNDYHPFVEALTYSLVALTTLGLGDVVPAEPLIRFLSPLEALTGFALLSGSVSWFMQLYPALARRRALAVELTSLHRSGITALPPELPPGRAASVIASVGRAIAELTADLVQNTEIFYFAERDERLSAARAVGYAMELRDQALQSGNGEVRLEGVFLEQVLDELARVVTDQYAHVTGESTDEVLRAVAGSHGHQLSCCTRICGRPGVPRNSGPSGEAGAYQLDLVTPGSSPRCAMSRKRTREMPNFVRTPRGRPSMTSRERTRTGDALRGSFCRPTRAASRSSSVDVGDTSAFFSSARLAA